MSFLFDSLILHEFSHSYGVSSPELRKNTLRPRPLKISNVYILFLVNCELVCVTLFRMLFGCLLSCFGFLDRAFSFFVFFFCSYTLPCLSLRLCEHFFGKDRYFMAASVWLCHMQG